MDKSGDSQMLDAWLAAVARGDRQAFARLYERMKAAVYGLALSIVRERTDAEDVMQNTFLRVWEHAGQYRPGTDARAWIFTITRNLALMLLRGRKKTTPVGEWTDEWDADGQGGDWLDKILLETLLASLDELERQIVLLYAVEGYSHKDIAALLGRPYATVRWKYSNAMKKLSRQLEESERAGQAPPKPAKGPSRTQRFAGLERT